MKSPGARSGLHGDVEHFGSSFRPGNRRSHSPHEEDEGCHGIISIGVCVGVGVSTIPIFRIVLANIP